MLKENDCITMDNWLLVCNVAGVVEFMEAFRKMAEQYYLDNIDVWKNTISITGISMKYVLKESLDNDKKLDLYAPGGICRKSVGVKWQPFMS